MTSPTPSPAPAPQSNAAVANEAPDAPADRAWSLRVYTFVVLSFVLWVALLIVLQRTFS